MPQVDLETLVVGGGGDRKVVCETLIDAGPMPVDPPPPANDPDLPAESFRVPVGDEIDWVDRNAAAYYDRDDSTKGTTNPKSQNSNPNPNHKLHSNSQRLSSSSMPKAPIIGLPNKLQHSGYLGRSARKTGRHQASGRIFPKKAVAGGTTAVPESEPTSPKVSCIGRVLSQKDRDRCRKTCRKASREESGESAVGERRRRRKTGFWAALFAVSCCGGGRGAIDCADEDSAPSGSSPAAGRKGKIPIPAARVSQAETAAETAAETGLGGMKRFASGRRPASWSGDLDVDGEATRDGHVDVSGPLKREGIWGRRSVGSLEDLDCGRNWESAGPASV